MIISLNSEDDDQDRYTETLQMITIYDIGAKNHWQSKYVR